MSHVFTPQATSAATYVLMCVFKGAMLKWSQHAPPLTWPGPLKRRDIEAMMHFLHKAHATLKGPLQQCSART